MTAAKNKLITLTVQGLAVSFEPNKTAYNGMINEMTMTNKVAPLVTYLGRIVTPDSKTALTQLLDENPGLEMQLAEKVNEIYAPKLEIEVKN
jgi:hypothetical protein